MIDKLPNFNEKQLCAIEGNANRLVATGDVKQRKNAESVLLAITVERKRRKDSASDRRNRLMTEIAEKVREKNLFEKVLLAFTEMPLREEEVAVLREIDSNPDANGATIAKAIGKQGVGAINLLVCTLCSAREHYLDAAPVLGRRKREKTYSSLLIDFTPHTEASGSQWFGWTLKPEAHAALKQLGIVE